MQIGTDALTSYPALHRAGLKPGSINHDLCTLRRVLGRAELWQVALPPQIPWRDIFLPEAALRQRHLSREEAPRLLAALPPDLGVMVRFAIMFGARLDTILRLRWQDVDDVANTITLQGVKSTAEGETYTLPITPDVRALLGSRRNTTWTRFSLHVPARHTRPQGRAPQGRGSDTHSPRPGWRRVWKRALAAVGIATPGSTTPGTPLARASLEDNRQPACHPADPRPQKYTDHPALRACAARRRGRRNAGCVLQSSRR